MPIVHASVDALVAEGLVRLSWKGSARRAIPHYENLTFGTTITVWR